MTDGPTDSVGGRKLRSLQDILNEADAEAGDLDRPDLEPLGFTLLSGKRIVFRDPDDVTFEETAAVDGVQAQIRTMCQSRADFNALWRELGQVPMYRAQNFATWVARYYEEERKKEKSARLSPGTGTK